MKLVLLVLFAISALSGYVPVVHGKHDALYSAFSPILKNKAKKRVKELIKSGRLRFGPDTTSEQKAQFAAMMLGSTGSKGRQGVDESPWILSSSIGGGGGTFPGQYRDTFSSISNVVVGPTFEFRKLVRALPQCGTRRWLSSLETALNCQRRSNWRTYANKKEFPRCPRLVLPTRKRPRPGAFRPPTLREARKDP